MRTRSWIGNRGRECTKRTEKVGGKLEMGDDIGGLSSNRAAGQEEEEGNTIPFPEKTMVRGQLSAVRGRGRKRTRAIRELEQGPLPPSVPNVIFNRQIAQGSEQPKKQESESKTSSTEDSTNKSGSPTETIPIDKAGILQLAKLVEERCVPFHGTIDPWKAQEWIEDLEDTFEYIVCRDVEKVHLATYFFRGQAMIWWRVQRQTFGIEPISWKQFKEAFESEYYPKAFRDARSLEFLRICQGDRSVLHYYEEFDKLAKFCSPLVETDADRCKYFVQGLAPYIQVQISRLILTSFKETLNRAISIEDTQGQLNKEKEQYCNKFQLEHGGKEQQRDRQNSQNKDQDEGNTMGDTSQLKKRAKRRSRLFRASSRLANTHQKKKSSDSKTGSQKRCYRCGNNGHQISECNLDQSICFYCKLPGHQRKNCALQAQHESKRPQAQQSHLFQQGPPLPQPPLPQQPKSQQGYQSTWSQSPASQQQYPQSQMYQLQAQPIPLYQSTQHFYPTQPTQVPMQFLTYVPFEALSQEPATRQFMQ